MKGEDGEVCPELEDGVPQFPPLCRSADAAVQEACRLFPMRVTNMFHEQFKNLL